MRKILIPLILLTGIIICAGCTTTQNPPATVAPTLTPALTAIPTPEATFESVTYSSQLVPIQTTVPVTTASQNNDPVIGRWNAIGAPAPCQVIFAEDNTGSLSCAMGMYTYGFDWINQGSDGLGNTSYEMTETNVQNPTVVDASLNSSGIMTASILPSNGYLVKVQ